MRESGLSKETRRKHALLVIGLGLIALVLSGRIGQPPKQATPESVRAASTPTFRPASMDLSASIETTNAQMIITNRDTFDWTRVKITINGGVFWGGFYLETDRIEAGQTYTVGLMQFADSDNRRFNPLEIKLRDIQIKTEQPSGTTGYWNGSFR